MLKKNGKVHRDGERESGMGAQRKTEVWPAQQLQLAFFPPRWLAMAGGEGETNQRAWR
jgi:hypothetical protein